METAIIYKSKYGLTKQYAIWISEQVKMDIFDINNIDNDTLEEYTTIILGSDIFYSQLSILPFLKKYKRLLIEKKLIVFVCEYIDNSKMIQKQLHDLFNKDIPVYSLKGLIPKEDVTLFDQFQLLITKYLNPKSKILLPNTNVIEKKNINTLLNNIKSTTH